MTSPPEADRGFSLTELLVVLGILGLVLAGLGVLTVRLQRDYESQRLLIELQDNARVSLDTLVRLVRMAGNNPRNLAGVQALRPDPDGNGALDSIQVQADWNPADGALDDPYENITFFTSDGKLLKREAGDPPAGVEFADGIESLTFAYSDTNGNAIADPIASPGTIAYVSITLGLRLTPKMASAPLAMSSAAAVRRRE